MLVLRELFCFGFFCVFVRFRVIAELAIFVVFFVFVLYGLVVVRFLGFNLGRFV